MTEPLNIYQALAEVMKKVSSVAKRDRNQQQGFSFRGVDAVVNAVAPQLRKIGVIVVPLVESTEYGTVEIGKNRTPMAHVSVTVTYRFYGPDGTHIDCRVPGEAMDSGDKATSKAMSVAFRTALLQALCLPTDEVDPDAAAYERSPAKTVEDYRAEALNLNATKEDLKRLYREVSRAGMIPQATVDEAGEQVRLGDLIVRRGHEAPDGLPRNKDGSISRSQASDEDLAKVGTMTRQEKKQHGKLEKETLSTSKKAERVDGAELFDPWANQVPSPAMSGAESPAGDGS